MVIDLTKGDLNASSFMEKYFELMEERDAFVVGQDNVWKYEGKKDKRGFYPEVLLVNTCINREKDSIRQRQKESL